MKKSNGSNGKVWRNVALLLLATGTLYSCTGSDGLDRVQVAGMVTVNGAPLESGQIAFLPMEGTSGPSTGTRIEKGRFDIPLSQGPVTGKHRVEILAVRSTGRQVKEGSGSETPDALVNEVEQYLPENYNTNSVLMLELSKDNAESVAFDLEIPK